MHKTPEKLGEPYMLPSGQIHSATSFKWQAGENEPGEDMGDDPNIKHLHELVDAYRVSDAETRRLRSEVDLYIQTLKRQGYSYPVLARESGFAQGTIQLIVAKEVE